MQIQFVTDAARIQKLVELIPNVPVKCSPDYPDQHKISINTNMAFVGFGAREVTIYGMAHANSMGMPLSVPHHLLSCFWIEQ
jgi:hypothetical protein